MMVNTESTVDAPTMTTVSEVTVPGAKELAKSRQVAAAPLAVLKRDMTDLKRELTEDEATEVRALRQRLAKRPKPPSFALGDDNKVTLRDGDVDKRLLHARLAAALGVTDARALTLFINQAADATLGNNPEQQCNTALSVLSGIQPRDEVEGMLAVQMLGCHNLGMALLKRARETDRADYLAISGNLAVKLLRTFTMQTEALARLRGQIRQQAVRVEHVTVEAGGQALVGALATRSPTTDGQKS